MSAEGITAVATHEATTEMLVGDGDTVVIGGLYKHSFREAQANVPGLSDVPVLGWLFRKRSKIDKIEELIIFITPRIMK